MQIIFLRGLNTYGDDLFRFGPLAFGPTQIPLMRSFEQNNPSPDNLKFVPILDMGLGTLPELIENAELLIKRLVEPTDELHLLGHSQGGLIARALAHQEFFKGRIRSIVTIGTPHHGAYFADTSQRFERANKIISAGLKLLSYDLGARHKYFKCLSSQSMREFNRRYPNLENIEYGHLLCTADRNLMGVPYQIGIRFTQDPRDLHPSDGLVSAKSQTWGVRLGTYTLDHAAELGFFFQVSPAKRRFLRQEFSRMVNDLIRFWSRSEPKIGT